MEWSLRLGDGDNTVVALVSFIGDSWVVIVTIDGRSSANLGHFHRDEIAIAIETAHTVAIRAARAKGLTAL